MTAQVHDHSMHETGQRPVSQAARAGGVRQAGQPRWLWPAVAAGLVVTGLVIAGVLSLSAVLYIGLFGGMLLMHGGGHGGHGGHEDHDGGATSDTEPLSHRSHGSQSEQTGSVPRLDDRATNDPNASRTNDHDQHSSHGCH